MNKKYFIDSDIILDLLAERDGFYPYAAELFTQAFNKKVELFTTAIVLANVFYILRKIKGNELSKEKIKDLRLLVNIVPVTEHIVDLSLNSPFNDLEDSMQYFTVKEHNLLGIITRNIRHYKVNDVIVQTAAEFIQTGWNRA